MSKTGFTIVVTKDSEGLWCAKGTRHAEGWATYKIARTRREAIGKLIDKWDADDENKNKTNLTTTAGTDKVTA